MGSAFRNAIDFFVAIGLYDVVLPFLLVFTLMFAFLEKTRVLGFDKVKIGGEMYNVPKKNLNAMVAFVTGLFVVLSAQLVGIVNEVLAHTVLLLMLSFLFLLVLGSFLKQSDDGVAIDPDKQKALYYLMVSISFIAIVLIFLNAIKTEGGDSWLSIVMDILMNAGSSDFWMVVILLVIIIGGIALVISGPKPDAGGSK
ncbi:MAG: hypothetical protein ACMXYL_02475 [Candidatus Woesearchaeota archaeon]